VLELATEVLAEEVMAADVTVGLVCATEGLDVEADFVVDVTVATPKLEI
jgi:hypothetical protein